MEPRQDDMSSTPPHGDVMNDPTAHGGTPASRHGVQLDPRGGAAADPEGQGDGRQQDGGDGAPTGDAA